MCEPNDLLLISSYFFKSVFYLTSHWKLFLLFPALQQSSLNLFAHIPINNVLELLWQSSTFSRKQSQDLQLISFFLVFIKLGYSENTKFTQSCSLSWLDFWSEFITVVPAYPREICLKTPSGCLIPWIVLNIHTYVFFLYKHTYDKV